MFSVTGWKVPPVLTLAFPPCLFRSINRRKILCYDAVPPSLHIPDSVSLDLMCWPAWPRVPGPDCAQLSFDRTGWAGTCITTLRWSHTCTFLLLNYVYPESIREAFPYFISVLPACLPLLLTLFGYKLQPACVTVHSSGLTYLITNYNLFVFVAYPI